tara:strand:- start:903 stop:1859 length:957 start_codon:yes stop_codon:yes gene_type:complete
MTEDWSHWVAEALFCGGSPQSVVSALAQQEEAPPNPEAVVISVLESPIFRSAWPKVRAGRRLALAASLQRQVQFGQEAQVEQREGLDPGTLYADYVRAHRPVVIPGFAVDWPALNWTHRSLAERLGDAPIEVLDGRDDADHPDRDFQALKSAMAPRAFAERVLEAAGNDLYLVANNHLMNEDRAQALLADLPFPEGFLATHQARGCSSLWWGPAGTKTAAHHDTCHAFFLQLVGRKHFVFASPLDPGLMVALDGYYQVQRDLRQISDQVLEVTLEPGDLLFIPVGWWHQVDALEASIAISFTNLLVPNRFDDYRPGAL